jgi:hypothetical protein
MNILAIDPGYKNLGWCVWHNGDVKVERTDIFNGQDFHYDRVFFLIRQWCRNHDDLFKAADIVVIEKQWPGHHMGQISCVLQVIMTVLQMYAGEKHVLVNPNDVKRYFNTSMGSHRLNKDAAVKFVRENHSGVLRTYGSGRSEKLDDICDALLLALFQVDNLPITVIGPSL